MLLESRRRHGARRIRLDDLVAMQITIEAPHARQRARDRPARELAAREVREESTHRETIDSFPTPRTRAVVAAEELDEVVQIAAVRFHRVRRHVTLLREVREEVVDLGAKRA